jgi:hypothetical protein
MTIFHAVSRGIVEVNRSRRMLLLFYAAASLPAIVGAAVVMAIPLASLGRSRWTEAMAGNLDLSWLAETAVQSVLPAIPMLAALLGVAALSRIVQLFLLGGTLAIFGPGEPFTAPAFFAGCGRNFWRIVRLAIFSLLFYAVAAAIHGGLTWGGNRLWGEGNEATPLVHWSWFTYVVLAVTLGLCSMAFDYGAIRLVTDDSRKAVRAYLGAFRMIWRAPRTVGLYAVIWMLALVLLATYQGASRVLPQTSLGLVFVLLLVRQCTVFGRVWTRLLFYSSQCAMYADLRPPSPPAPVVEREPEGEALVAQPSSDVVETPPEGGISTQMPE